MGRCCALLVDHAVGIGLVLPLCQAPCEVLGTWCRTKSLPSQSYTIMGMTLITQYYNNCISLGAVSDMEKKRAKQEDKSSTLA